MRHISDKDFENRVSRIAFVDGYEYRYLLLGIARYLKSNFNSYIFVYVQSIGAREELKPYIEKNYIDEIKVVPEWKDISLKEVSDTERSSVLNAAVEMEKFLGVTYNKVRMTRRDLGLGFYLGAYYHPRSVFSEKPVYEQIVKAYNVIFEYWKNEFLSEKITLVINGLKEPDVVANALNIPFRYLFCTRIDNYFHWTKSVLCDFPEVKKHYEALQDQEFSPVRLDQQFFLDLTHKEKIFSISAFLHFLKNIRSLLFIRLYHLIKRKEFKGYYFWPTLRSLWKSYKDRKKLTYPKVSRLSDLKEKEFVYFPLATEPEMSLHWMSPEYISQLAAITSIARDLPADTILIVKESIYSLGARSDEFYDHIKRLKNTVLLDVKELGLDVISAAKAVITISGTSGLEAAIMGIPVVLLGRHNYYDFLDHVFLVKQDEQLAPAIQAVIRADFDQDKAKTDGARLRQAAINASFDLKDFTNINRHQFDDEILQNIIEGLKDSFNEEIQSLVNQEQTVEA